MSLDLRPVTVFGYWAETRERWYDTYMATSVRNAEDQAQLHASETGGTLRVCAVAEGDLFAADKYTAYLDVSDERNLERDDLEPDMPDFTLGTDPYWTVLGLAAPAGCKPGDPEIATRGERYGDIVSASSAGAAEDVARDRLHDRHGDLLVCAVLAGRVSRADAYATFCDPDVKAAL